MDTEENRHIFCRTIKQRSNENQKAITILYENGLYSNSISILRQELDSLIRVIFLLTINDLDYRNNLMCLFNAGHMWLNENNRRSTERQMVEIAYQLHGWAKLVYKFGCGFIHLSNLHDYYTTDPIEHISEIEKNDIIRYMNQYHNANLSDDVTFQDIMYYVLPIFEKIKGNLECYLEPLENNEILTYVPGAVVCSLFFYLFSSSLRFFHSANALWPSSLS